MVYCFRVRVYSLTTSTLRTISTINVFTVFGLCGVKCLRLNIKVLNLVLKYFKGAGLGFKEFWKIDLDRPCPCVDVTLLRDALWWCLLLLYTLGKEKLADYLDISADEARNITHSFLGRFCSLIYLLALTHRVASSLLLEAGCWIAYNQFADVR